MKSVFDPSVRNELISRIHFVNEKSPAQWGKMNAYQMVKHCRLCDEMFQGSLKIKRVFIGRLIGPMVLKKVLKDDKPFGKNAPTSERLCIPEPSGDISKRKNEWISRIREYEHFNNPAFVHPFFGPMTPEQVGRLAYKHADHHLRQFGA